MEKITINCDFDGTVVTHEFPRVGKDIGAARVLKRLVQNGHQLILFTMRNDSDDILNEHFEIVTKGVTYLTDAVNWFKENDIPLYGIQTNPTQHLWTSSPKSYAQIMIDDSALGCPLKFDEKLSNRPFVDWLRVEEMLLEIKLIKEDV
jgi:hypothetical protein